MNTPVRKDAAAGVTAVGGRRRMWLGGGAATLCGVALWWVLAADQQVKGSEEAARGAPAMAAALAPLSAPSTAIPAIPVDPAAEAASAAAIRAPIQKINVDVLRKTGSLRGTELDGDWGQFAGGVLKPSHRLRQRFDHLLIGLGEVDPAGLRSWIAEQARFTHGDKGAAQLLAVWDAYEKLLRSQVGGKAPDPSDATAWQRWIAERSALRSAALGPAWADAFFADEHQQLKDFGERAALRVAAAPGALEPEAAAQRALLPSGAALDTKAIVERQVQRVQYFGEEGAQRLAAEDKAWADWNQRIEAARQRRQQILSDKQLSELQRQQALEADLARHFQGTDLIRAKGLVTL